MAEPSSVIVVEPQFLYRAGLRALVEATPTTRAVAEASDLAGALAAVARYDPDLVVTALELPDGRVGALLDECAVHGRGAVLVCERVELDRARRLARGRGVAVARDAPPDVFSSALAEAVPRAQAAGRAVRGAGLQGSSLLRTLSARERSVLSHLGENRTSREIARSLHLSVRTVENHRARICRKLGLRGRNRLLALAIALRTELGAPG